MPGEIRRYGALVRFLRTTAGRLGAVEHRLEQIGMLDDAVAFELRSMRKSATRWADRIDGPPAQFVDEDEVTAPIIDG